MWSLLPKDSDFRAYNKYSNSNSSAGPFSTFCLYTRVSISTFLNFFTLMQFRISCILSPYVFFSALIVGSGGCGSVLLYVPLPELRAGLLASWSGTRGPHKIHDEYDGRRHFLILSQLSDEGRSIPSADHRFNIVLLPENLHTYFELSVQAWTLYKAPQWNARHPNSCPERIKL